MSRRSIQNMRAYMDFINASERIGILKIERFVAASLYEWSAFQLSKRPLTVRRLVDACNRIIDQCETDPRLKIAMG